MPQANCLWQYLFIDESVVYLAKKIEEVTSLKLLQIIVMIAVLSIMTGTGDAQQGKVQLTWDNAQDAVMYELQVATTPFKKKRATSKEQIVYSTTEIFTPGVELNLALFNEAQLNKLYFRVRPLDLDKNPIAEFSRGAALSKGIINPQKPTPTAFLKKGHPAALYPVYSWIPVLGASRYEVEITNRPPENANAVQPSQYRVLSYTIEGGFDCYDTHAYTDAGRYYWRVRALGADNEPIGTYSDAICFNVQTSSHKWAAFGDSITHGGGAISNPPSDERFEYVSYLPFPVKNLGKSGDTIAMMVERFETDVLPFKPQYMFVLGGSNSIRGGTSGESVIADLQTIKEKCALNGITPIFLTLPPINPERIQRVFNEPTADNWQEELAKVNDFIRNQPNAIEIYSLLADEQGLLPVEYAEDGLHPDISGKKIMARSVNAFLHNHTF